MKYPLEQPGAEEARLMATENNVALKDLTNIVSAYLFLIAGGHCSWNKDTSFMRCELFHSFYDDNSVISQPNPTKIFEDGLNEIKVELKKERLIE